jgi:hypothetical protein
VGVNIAVAHASMHQDTWPGVSKPALLMPNVLDALVMNFAIWPIATTEKGLRAIPG